MTDNEIIKALECCVSEKDTCQNCPFQELKHYDYENEMFEIMPNGKQYDDWSCERWLNVAVLDLITRQQAEIDYLMKETAVTTLIDDAVVYTPTIEDYTKFKKKIKSEAVKEFADEFEFEILYKPSEFKAVQATEDFLNGMTHRQHEILDILKEMVGENE